MKLTLRNRNRREKRKVELYERADGLWSWRLRAPNGQVVATDGGQGYSAQADAANMAESVTGLKPVVLA